MGKKIKKGTKGAVTQFLTRSRAIRKLQLSLSDFRTLCILKGIYPREPKKRFKNHSTNKTYYHVKDINFLAREELVDKFRETKAHLKKHKRAVNRGDKKLAELILKQKPKLTLHHLIKERYPSFDNALRDIDDALCMLNLFANFSSHQTHQISTDQIQLCKRLTYEFMYFVILTQSLNKSYLTVKGIYYSATINAVNIVWLVPYKFSQKLPFDVDYKIMLTFLDFYQTLVKFVNFKLFNDLGLEYPPPALADLSNFSFLNIQGEIRAKQRELEKKFEKKEKEIEFSEEFKDSEEVKTISEAHEDRIKSRNLFKNLVFYLNRETPTYSLEFMLLSRKCKIGYDSDSSQIKEADKSITHHICDRPQKNTPSNLSTEELYTNREHIQPQWVYDCINHSFLLPTLPYFPGTPLPAHLSPFVDNHLEGYVPPRQIQIDKLKGKQTTKSQTPIFDFIDEQSDHEQQEKPFTKELVNQNQDDDENISESEPEDKEKHLLKIKT